MLRPLLEELDRWAERGLMATFWWRDDDAVTVTAALDRLINASKDAGLLLAVIPKFADLSLADEILKHKHITVGQHGYAHVNHAPRGQGSGAWELGLHRGVEAVMDDLILGKEILTRLFADKAIPVVVAPWNRIDPELFPYLKAAGYRGVSAFGINDSNDQVEDLVQLNCHCDPIKWKGGPRFAGEQKSIEMICEHLQTRRNNEIQIDHPTGFLTHHLDMDEDSWSFTARLNQTIIEHPAAQWCDPRFLVTV